MLPVGLRAVHGIKSGHHSTFDFTTFAKSSGPRHAKAGIHNDAPDQGAPVMNVAGPPTRRAKRKPLFRPGSVHPAIVPSPGLSPGG